MATLIYFLSSTLTLEVIWYFQEVLGKLSNMQILLTSFFLLRLLEICK